MPEPAAPPRLLAQGRDTDVYALDDTTVLRRYRDPTHSNTLMEAKVMAYLAEHGYPVPRVHDATDTDLVLERLHGPTLLEDWRRRPGPSPATPPGSSPNSTTGSPPSPPPTPAPGPRAAPWPNPRPSPRPAHRRLPSCTSTCTRST